MHIRGKEPVLQVISGHDPAARFPEAHHDLGFSRGEIGQFDTHDLIDALFVDAPPMQDFLDQLVDAHLFRIVHVGKIT